MTKWEEVEAKSKAVCAAFNATVAQAEFVASKLHSLGVPVGKIKLNPYGWGMANKLIPLEEIEGIPPGVSMALQMEILGTIVEHVNAGQALRMLAFAPPFGEQMLLDGLSSVLSKKV